MAKTTKTSARTGQKRAVKQAPGKARIHSKTTRQRAKKRPAKNTSRRKKQEACWWALPVSCVMLLILSAFILLSIHEIGEHRRFRTMRSAVESEGFYSGIVVDGYSLSGVTLKDAVSHWENTIEPMYRDRTVTLTYGGRTWSIDAERLGYTSDYQSVLYSAWGQGRSGTLEQRYRTLNTIRTDSEWYEVSRTMFDENLLKAWTNEIAFSISKAPKNAEITGFNVETKAFSVSDSEIGYGVDADALFESARSMLANGGGSMEINVSTLYPTVTKNDFSGKYGLITTAVTNASSSSKDRITNLKLACSAINGYCVEPGGVFSFNDVVGERTKKRGYKKATVYVSGEVAEDIGGGVCQVSTTLWNAAMKANCEIVERVEHSRPVSYVDRGKDATVSWGYQDMKFKNTSSSPMYLVAYVSENKRVYCEVYGELFPDGKYITVEAKTTEKIQPPEPKYTYNPLFEPGYSVTITEGRMGYRAKAYRVYWNADGTEISRELLCSSYYKPSRGEVEYG